MIYDIPSIIKRFDSGEYLEYVFFWGHQSTSSLLTRACLSQWYPCVFDVDGITYNCAEQYMMSEKARMFEDDAAFAKILASSDPKIIKAIGREVKNFNVKKWASESKDIVIKGNMHKFAQNIELRGFLLHTDNKILVEASPYDTIWGIGMKESEKGVMNPHNWKGFNKLGFALMEVRDRLSVKKN